MTVTQLFDALAIRVDGPKAWSERFALAWDITDTGERYRMELSNGALVHSRHEPRRRRRPRRSA